jgi:hypothetical protein
MESFIQKFWSKVCTIRPDECMKFRVDAEVFEKCNIFDRFKNFAL